MTKYDDKKGLKGIDIVPSFLIKVANNHKARYISPKFALFSQKRLDPGVITALHVRDIMRGLSLIMKSYNIVLVLSYLYLKNNSAVFNYMTEMIKERLSLNDRS